MLRGSRSAQKTPRYPTKAFLISSKLSDVIPEVVHPPVFRSLSPTALDPTAPTTPFSATTTGVYKNIDDGTAGTDCLVVSRAAYPPLTSGKKTTKARFSNDSFFCPDLAYEGETDEIYDDYNTRSLYHAPYLFQSIQGAAQFDRFRMGSSMISAPRGDNPAARPVAERRQDSV